MRLRDRNEERQPPAEGASKHAVSGFGAGINIQPTGIYIGPIADSITPTGILIAPEVVSMLPSQLLQNCDAGASSGSVKDAWHTSSGPELAWHAQPQHATVSCWHCQAVHAMRHSGLCPGCNA